jgi:hypothetical protein
MQIAFGYPRRGLSGEFNTFRLGLNWSRRVTPGETVELVDARTKKVLKRAVVTQVVTGALGPLAIAHAHQAHNWKNFPEDQRSALLIAALKKRYLPGRVREDSPCSVIYLKELEDASETVP